MVKVSFFPTHFLTEMLDGKWNYLSAKILTYEGPIKNEDVNYICLLLFLNEIFSELGNEVELIVKKHPEEALQLMNILYGNLNNVELHLLVGLSNNE